MLIGMILEDKILDFLEGKSKITEGPLPEPKDAKEAPKETPKETPKEAPKEAKEAKKEGGASAKASAAAQK
jgi:hypothetical protein